MEKAIIKPMDFIQSQDAWDKLSLPEKAEMIKVAVQNGIYNLNDIREKYNEFAEGGSVDTDWSYNSWKRQIAERMGIKPDEDNTYDYEAYFKKYPEEAWKMLKGDPTAHFSDEFKTVYHPTFSSKSIGNDGSIYSGVKNPKTNPQGLIGGTWSPDYHTFTMSPDGYRGPVSMDDRKWYLENAEDNGVQLREADGSLPIYDGIPWGGVLPNVTVYGTRHSLRGPLVEATNEYRHGGGIHIKPSRRGTFTAAASKHGKSVQAFASQVLAHPENYSPAMRKKANFARNTKKFKHSWGGPLVENLFYPGGYVRDINNHPVAFDEEGNLIDQVTGEQGIMKPNIPEIVVTGRDLTKPYYSSFDGSVEPYVELFGALSKGFQPLSLSQQYGAVADAVQGRKNYFDSLFNGNSGFFTDKYAEEHPLVSTIGNIAGDIIGPILGGNIAAKAYKAANMFLKDNYTGAFGKPSIPFKENALPNPKQIEFSKNVTVKAPFIEWGNDSRFKVSPSIKKYNDILKQLSDAKAYKESQQYKNLAERASVESEKLGIGNFDPDLFDSGNAYLNKLTVSDRAKDALGSYNPKTNSMDLDLTQIGNLRVPYHEGIHWQRVGSPDNIGPLFEDWWNARRAGLPKEEEQVLFNKFFNSSEYNRYLQRKNADAYLDRKVEDALYPFADGTLRKQGELQAYGLEAGKAIGIEPFSEYPGINKALDAINKARRYDPTLNDIKSGGEENVKRFWDILSGNYIPSFLLGTASTSLPNND